MNEPDGETTGLVAYDLIDDPVGEGWRRFVEQGYSELRGVRLPNRVPHTQADGPTPGRT